MGDHGKTGGAHKAAPKGAFGVAGALAVRTRGKFFEGTVVSDKMHGSVIVEWPRVVWVPKYNRFKRLSSRVKARNPEGLGARSGDTVRIEETRKLSKTMNFIVTAVIKRAEHVRAAAAATPAAAKKKEGA